MRELLWWEVFDIGVHPVVVVPADPFGSDGLNPAPTAWAYNYSRTALEQNMGTLIDTYNHEVETFQPTGTSAAQRLEEAKAHATYDNTRIKWNAGLLDALSKQRWITLRREAVRIGTYRPFTKQFLYFDSVLNERTYRLPSMFPTPNHPNHGFYLTGAASNFPFAVLAVNGVPDLHHFDTGQFFPATPGRSSSQANQIC